MHEVSDFLNMLTVGQTPQKKPGVKIGNPGYILANLDFWKDNIMRTPIEATHLGKQTAYPKKYDPSLLVAVPRSANRERYGLTAHDLPFCGVDVWHCWEAGFLTHHGLPVVGVMKITYPCDTHAIVESKSLKLYLNSFNMEKLGSTVSDAAAVFVSRVTQDMSTLLKSPVTVRFQPQPLQGSTDFDQYILMDALPAVQTATFTAHMETPALLQVDTANDTSGIRVCTHLLRSNCKITHQPDWGSAFIYLDGRQIPTVTSLMQYLVSFRGENHFHEEVCEMIYKRLFDTFVPDELAVTCIYTRRGGIDICPARASDSALLPANLTSAMVLTPKLPRQ